MPPLPAYRPLHRPPLPFAGRERRSSDPFPSRRCRAPAGSAAPPDPQPPPQLPLPFTGKKHRPLTQEPLPSRRPDHALDDAGLQPARQLVAVDAFGLEDAWDGAALGLEEPEQDVPWSDLAVAAAFGLLVGAREAHLG